MSKNISYNSIREDIHRKYKKELNEKDFQLKQLKSQLSDLSDENESLKAQIREKDEWIERLLDYCNLSPEELHQNIEEEKHMHDTVSKIHAITASNPILNIITHEFADVFSILGDKP